jgi:hypothetical protein
LYHQLLTLDAGSRGGKRSVTLLSKEQLARKRANDREAQRNIRQRTKEHIENLEKKVKELEEHNRSSSMDRVMKRNKELEAEVEKLRSQIAAQTAPVVPEPVAVPAEMPEGMLIPQKVSLEWSPEAPSCPWPGAMSPDILVSNGNYTSNTSPVYPTETTAISYGGFTAAIYGHSHTSGYVLSRSLFLYIHYQSLGSLGSLKFPNSTS